MQASIGLDSSRLLYRKSYDSGSEDRKTSEDRLEEAGTGRISETDS